MEGEDEKFHKLERRVGHDLFEVALSEDFDYYYQIGDDVVMETPWANRFVELLQKHDLRRGE